MKKQRIYLYVDGSNLYGAQYDLFGPEKYIDFAALIKQVEEKIGVHFDKIYFYASYSPKSKKPTRKEKLYLKNEALFYRSVHRTKNIIFFKGYRSKTSGKEKEVDVKLTADLVRDGFQNAYQTVYLFSGDADFLQALFTITKLRKKIAIICFQNKILFKGSYYFKTYILCVSKIKIGFQQHQRIDFIKLDTSSITKVLS